MLVINQLGVTPEPVARGGNGRDRQGPDFSVNGRLQPTVDHAARRSAAVAHRQHVGPRSGAFFAGSAARAFQWKQLAQDGVQFADANYQNSLNQLVH